MQPVDPSTLSAAELAAILRFYADAGVDCMVEESPVDRFAESDAARSRRAGPIMSERAAASAFEQPREPAAMPAGGPGSGRIVQSSPAAAASSPQRDLSQTIAVPDEAAIADARTLARKAGSIAELRDAVAAFSGCNLRVTAKNLVFADGTPEARIMFVGEAPGREEDIQGLPFVGKAGQMLDLMLRSIGLDRQSAYITNMIFWRPPGNRTPTPHEIAVCRPFTERHIELVDPAIVVFLGNVATRGMLETTRGILSLRGTWSDYRIGEKTYPALPTLHPAYLLRNPAHKKLAWRDFLALRARIEALKT
jgi:uracil-DNA glycosylase